MAQAGSDGWEVRAEDGLVSTYGTAGAAGDDPAAVADPTRRSHVFSWLLVKTVDPFGNSVEYEYERDAGESGPHLWDQLYVSRIRYIDYVDAGGEQRHLADVAFEYGPAGQERPDPGSDYRAGFEIRTRRSRPPTSWPEPDPAWIPQTLWWKAVPAILADHAHSALVRSLLAMALAKTGNTSDWTAIADHLQLPASHAHRIGRLTYHLERRDSWPAVLTALERLMTGLQQHPPPIDYPVRREVGQHLDLLSAAVEAGRRRHPTTVPTETLQQQPWERFTGGDIAYAPLPIRIGLFSPDHRRFHRQHGIGEADLFHVAHQYLQRTADIEGPLIWRPGLLPAIAQQTRWRPQAAADVETAEADAGKARDGWY